MVMAMTLQHHLESISIWIEVLYGEKSSERVLAVNENTCVLFVMISTLITTAQLCVMVEINNTAASHVGLSIKEHSRSKRHKRNNSCFLPIPFLH